MPRPHHPRRLALEVLAALVVGLVLAVGIDIARTGSLELWLTRRGWAPPYIAQGKLVDIGGRSLYLDCRGSGSPTVILESGLTGDASSWGFVLPKVEERTRVCAYDRAGLGRSDPEPAVRSVGEAVADLRRALDVAGERGPFVLVGHSYGGVLVRVFAGQAHDEVRGVVLVDAWFPDGTWVEQVAVHPGVLADHRAAVVSTNELIARTEGIDWPASATELAASHLDGIPTEVLAVDQHLRYNDPRISPGAEEALIDAWRAWCLALSPGMSRVTIAGGSGHSIQLDRPDVVLAAIDRMIDAARDSG